MNRKIYRTAQGKQVDVSALMMKNEDVRAVGNMGVNARGDKLGVDNSVTDSRDAQVARHYKKQTMATNVNDTPVMSSRKAALDKQKQQRTEQVIKPVTEENQAVSPLEDVKVGFQGGLAAAIAKSREVRQQEEKSARDMLKSKGLQKI